MMFPFPAWSLLSLLFTGSTLWTCCPMAIAELVCLLGIGLVSLLEYSLPSFYQVMKSPWFFLLVMLASPSPLLSEQLSQWVFLRLSCCISLSRFLVETLWAPTIILGYQVLTEVVGPVLVLVPIMVLGSFEDCAPACFIVKHFGRNFLKSTILEGPQALFNLRINLPSEVCFKLVLVNLTPVVLLEALNILVAAVPLISSCFLLEFTEIFNLSVLDSLLLCRLFEVLNIVYYISKLDYRLSQGLLKFLRWLEAVFRYVRNKFPWALVPSSQLLVLLVECLHFLSLVSAPLVALGDRFRVLD